MHLYYVMKESLCVSCRGEEERKSGGVVAEVEEDSAQRGDDRKGGKRN